MPRKRYCEVWFELSESVPSLILEQARKACSDSTNAREAFDKFEMMLTQRTLYMKQFTFKDSLGNTISQVD